MADATKGQLDLLLLAVVRARPAHGYAVIEELKYRSDGLFDLPESTAYPALHRLETDGLLESSWTEVGGRRRRVYRITRRGERALGERHQAWLRFAGGVASALGEVR